MTDAPAIFITGASSGLGAALAREFARRWPGARLGLLARRAEALASLAAELQPVQSFCYAVDVTDADAIRAAADAFVQQVGAPDVVIANAGVSIGTLTSESGDAAVFRRVVQTNLIALPETFAPFLPAMLERGQGTLVGIGSMAGVRGLPGSGAYSASKAAVATYLESLRVELRASGLSVVTIAPGYVRTPMTAGNAYRMPFLLDASVFARRAVDAIVARRRFVVIPWQMALVAKLMRLLPNFLYDRLAANAPHKARAPARGQGTRS